MKKVKGYTLTEVLLVLILGTLVSGMGYMGIELIMKQFYLTKKINEIAMDEHTGLARFKKDFVASRKVLVNNNRLEMDQTNRVIEYTFSDNNLIRRDIDVDKEDTLFNNIAGFQFYFENVAQFIARGETDSIVIFFEYDSEEMQRVFSRDLFAKDKIEELVN